MSEEKCEIDALLIPDEGGNGTPLKIFYKNSGVTRIFYNKDGTVSCGLPEITWEDYFNELEKLKSRAEQYRKSLT